MIKPAIPANEIPKDVWAAAEEALDNMLCHCRESSGSTKAFRRNSINEIAQAILAERTRNSKGAPELLEACKKLVHWHAYRGADNELRHRDCQLPEIAYAMDAIARAGG